jgi:hypothetical protein
MRGFLAEHLGVFDPDDIRILVAAFDKAWEAVQASGAVFDSKARPTLRGRYSQNMLLPLPRTASVTRGGFAMAL